MSAPFKRRPAAARCVDANGFLRLALCCGRNVYGGIDRRMPEARALAVWLGRALRPSASLNSAVPDDEALQRGKHRGVAALDWRRIGAALDEADAFLPDRRDAAVDRWLGAIAGTLGLDPLETRILALALHYQLDQRVERLFDLLSECRGGPTRLHRDILLIALLLRAPAADVDARLTADARLQASGLLRLGGQGELEVLERLTSLIRRDISPEADFYDQLLGTMTAEPLPWDAFAHLGREAEVAAAVLRAALAEQESGVNVLLYGPPGTGKTSFAATLASSDRSASAPRRRSRRERRRTAAPRTACRPPAGPTPCRVAGHAAAVRRGGGSVRQ